MIAHLANYFQYSNLGVEKHVEFKKRFPNSPLILALANTRGFDGFIKLAKDPEWGDLALLCAAHQIGEGSQTERFTTAFWKRADELAKDDQVPVLSHQIATHLQRGDRDRLKKFLSQQLGRQKTIGGLLQYASFLGSIDEWRVSADRAEDDSIAAKHPGKNAFEIAYEALKLDDDETSLLNRYAYAIALAAGEKHKESMVQFEIILKKMKSSNVAASPAMLATIARVAQQAGQEKRAVELEEEALIAEQPHLPEAINLNAFRQRYRWLWNQYLGAAEKIDVSTDDGRSEMDDLLKRATLTYDRWKSVDSDNDRISIEMARLQSQAKRPAEAWKYVSTIIDEKPRDAVSYSNVGGWLHDNQKYDEAETYYREATKWDTANPQWLFEHAKSLRQINREKEANETLDKIINGTWAPGLQRWIERAQEEKGKKAD